MEWWESVKRTATWGLRGSIRDECGSSIRAVVAAKQHIQRIVWAVAIVFVLVFVGGITSFMAIKKAQCPSFKQIKQRHKQRMHASSRSDNRNSK